jgi:hypothetical protein
VFYLARAEFYLSKNRRNHQQAEHHTNPHILKHKAYSKIGIGDNTLLAILENRKWRGKDESIDANGLNNADGSVRAAACVSTEAKKVEGDIPPGCRLYLLLFDQRRRVRTACPPRAHPKRLLVLLFNVLRRLPSIDKKLQLTLCLRVFIQNRVLEFSSQNSNLILVLNTIKRVLARGI